jgi:hypothetical protein
MRLQCVHCNYIWEYRGNHNFWATCPQCRYKVRIIQKPMEMLEETGLASEIENEVDDKRVVDVVGAFLKKYEYRKNSLIQILLDIQQSYGWLPREMLSEVSRQLNVSYSQIYQIATFLRANSSSGLTTEPPETQLETKQS